MTETVLPTFGEDIRKEFMLRENSVFLNHGSFGSMPRCVHDRQVRYLAELESNPDVWFRYNVNKYLADSKARVAEYMGVSTEDTFLLQNVTKAINTVLKTYPLRRGDAYLITSLTYHAVKLTTKATIARTEGAKRYILKISFPVIDEDSIVEMYENFLDTHQDVKLTVVDHITSRTSMILPVKRITEVCHRHGVVVVVDAAQVPGQLKVDIQDIDADFYTGDLHKWLCCPRACSFMWMNPRRQHTWVRPLVTSSRDNDNLQKAFAFEGTKDDTPFLCSADGIDFHNRIGGLDNIVEYGSSLITKGIAYLEDKWGTKRLAMPEHMNAPLLRVLQLPFIPGFSDTMDSVPINVLNEKCKELQELLKDLFAVQITVFVNQRKLMARLSVFVYNTMDDFIRLAYAVQALTNGKEEKLCAESRCT